MLTVSDPMYWSSRVAELREVLADVAGDTRGGDLGQSRLAAGAASTTSERLTMTVEEAAAALGISRAFAYESVHRGDIPSIRIGRRILVPRAALQRLVDDTTGTAS
jgi:excisionase family DNA binding protein